jgi:hypothetical protein
METAGTKPNRNATKNNNTQMAKQLNTYYALSEATKTLLKRSTEKISRKCQS